MGISPAGGTGVGIVSPCGATYFAHVGKVGKTPPGAAHGHFQCPIPPPPDPPFNVRGSHQVVLYFHPARVKDMTLFTHRPLPLRVGLTGLFSYKNNRAWCSTLAGWSSSHGALNLSVRNRRACAVRPYEKLSGGRRGETKFRTTFFAKLSFKKAGAPAGPGHGNSRRSHKIMEKQPQRLSGA